MDCPTWRTRMPPARTNCPPYTLTPRYCGLEPRPLRVEPPPFLCAIASDLETGDLHRGEGLPVPALAAVLLAPTKLEDDELLAPPLLDDLALHEGAADRGLANLGGAVVADGQEHLAKLHLVTGVALELLDADRVALGDPILLTTGSNNCSCHGKGSRNLVRGPALCKPEVEGRRTKGLPADRGAPRSRSRGSSHRPPQGCAERVRPQVFPR